MINVYPMKAEKDGPHAYEDFIREEGCPTILRQDNSKIFPNLRLEHAKYLDEPKEPVEIETVTLKTKPLEIPSQDKGGRSSRSKFRSN